MSIAMSMHPRPLTRLRYKSEGLAQARAHVRYVAGRTFFFFRDPRLMLAPGAPVCLEWTFASGAPHRILHGRAHETESGVGVWLELADARSLRELEPLIFTRSAHRLGTDLPVWVLRLGRAVAAARMLDLSLDGARIGGLESVSHGESLELRLLFPDGPGFRDLGSAFVAWTDNGEAGIKFDRLDSFCRIEVARLVGEVEDLWAKAPCSVHLRSCCGPQGLIEPALPHLSEQQAG